MERKTDNRKEAIYARQSADVKQSLSIETQVDDCRTKCRTKDPLIFTDRGYSGKNTNRPALQELLKQIKANKIKKVIVYRLDRISRNTADFFNLHEMMKQYKCDFQSVSEDFDTSSTTGTAMMSFLAIFAQMERENIQQRVKDNYYFRIKDGRWAGGPAPYGKINGRTYKNIPTLYEDKEEIKAVEFMFKEYIKPEMSLSKLAKLLSEKGYTSRKREKFDTVTVARILQNPVYAIADQTLYNYYDSKFIQFANEKKKWKGKTSAAIVGKKVNNQNIRAYTDMSEQTIYLTNFKGKITSDIFVKVQKKLSENQQITSTNKPTLLKELAGKLKCGHCGYAMKSYSKSTNGQPYLSCYNARTLKSCVATFHGLKFEKIRQTVGREVQDVLNRLDKIFIEKREQQSEIYQKIDEMQQEISNMIRLSAKANDEEVESYYLKEIKMKKKEIAELELQLSLRLDVLDDFELLSKVDFRNNISIQYDVLEDREKKIIVQQLIDKILIYDKDNIEIIWKI